MKALTKLTCIKLIHTAVWVGFNGILFYLLYAVVTNQIDFWAWMAVIAILLEGLLVRAFKNHCPLTLVARRYSDSRKDNFDIFLPNWLARHNKLIYTTFFVILLIFLVFRLITS